MNKTIMQKINNWANAKQLCKDNTVRQKIEHLEN